jgi:hypothetical protein
MVCFCTGKANTPNEKPNWPCQREIMYSVAEVCWEERNMPTVEYGPHKAAVSGKCRRHTKVFTVRN